MLSLGSQGETPRCSPIGSPIGSPKASQGGSRRGTPATDVPSQVSSPQLAQPPAAAAAQSSQQPPPCHIPLSVAPAQTAQWHYSATAMGPVTSGRSGLGAARASPLLQCRVSSSNPISDDMIGGARRLAHEGKPRAPDQGRHTQSTVNTTACDESQPAIASRSVDPSGTSAHNKSVSQAWSCQAVAPGSRSAGGVFDLEDVKPQSPLPDPRWVRLTCTAALQRCHGWRDSVHGHGCDTTSGNGSVMRSLLCVLRASISTTSTALKASFKALQLCPLTRGKDGPCGR